MSLRQLEKKQQLIQNNNKKDYKIYGWRNVAIKIKENDLILFNRQLDKLGFETLRSSEGPFSWQDNTIDRR